VKHRIIYLFISTYYEKLPVRHLNRFWL